ncbi:MAG: AtpZ/AtpI family protein [Chloroflexi bacterium]|nr:AtpZ/AtpI family protein [Chloroflexota bacterium]
MRNTVVPIAVIMQLGAAVVAGTLVPLFVGLWLDSVLRTTPWITLVSVVVGVITAIAAVYRIITTQYKKFE